HPRPAQRDRPSDPLPPHSAADRRDPGTLPDRAERDHARADRLARLRLQGRLLRVGVRGGHRARPDLSGHPSNRARRTPRVTMTKRFDLTTPLMNIVKNRVDGVTILDIQGVIKLGESAREFSSYLEKVLNDDTGPVMINFESINYMDSTGLGELIGYLQKFEDRHRKMALV